MASCGIAGIPRQHRFMHACTHTHTQNMELSVPGNKESNYKITKYGTETNEYVTCLTLLFRLKDYVSILVNMTGRLIDWLLSNVICKTWHKNYFLLKT